MGETFLFKISEGKLTREDIDSLASREKVYIPENKESNANAGTFRDVHYYDGQGVSIKLSEEVPSREEMKKAFNQLIRVLRNPSAGSMVHIIYSRNGYDGINKINTDLLLYNIICSYITIDLFYLLEEQLADNYNLGQCLQGVSWRLRQIYQAQKEM